MHNYLGKIVGLFFLVCGLATPTSAALKDASEFVLDNGMQVIVIPNHKAPIIHHAVLYKVGSIDEPEGKGGLAHLTEHLMFRGTHKFKDGKFNQLIENNGGLSNAGTSHDFTYYYQFLNIKSLELAMYLESDRMTGLDFSDDAFNFERKIVYQERQQRMNSDTASGFWEKFNRFYFGNNPYGRPVAGTQKEIASLSKEDVMDFYHKYYTPNNAILILSGDIDVDVAKELAQKYYGGIKAQELESAKQVTVKNLSAMQQKPISISGAQADVSVNRMVGQYILPHFSGADKEIYALMLYSQWLGEGVNSLLYQELVEKQKLAVSVGTEFSYLSRGNSLFYFYSYFKNTSDAEKIKQAFTKMLKTSEAKITEKKLQELKEKILAGQIYHNDNPADASNIVLNWLSAGYSLQDMKNFEENINNLTLNDIKQVIKKLQEIYPSWGIISPLGGAA